MTGREVTLFLKYPGPVHALQRLQHSFLECVIEYKTGSDGELQTKLPTELFSQYQMKGTAIVADDEIIVEFTPKNSGIHSARLFSDTREICRPVPFIVNRRGETINIPPDRPVKKPPPAPQNLTTPTHLPAPTFYGLNNPRFPHSPSTSPVPMSVTSEATSAAQTEPPPGQDVDTLPGQIRAYTSDPSLSEPAQGVTRQLNFSPQRASQVSPSGTRPPSMRVEEAGVHMGPGDPIYPRPHETNFDHLYTSKQSGGKVYGTRRGPLTIDYQSVVTADTLRMLSKEANIQMKMFRGGKPKKRCDICSKKVKVSKAVSIGEEDYCDSCFRRQFLLRTAIEHFMVPSIQECNIQVPINKRGTRFVTARKTIANVNLRGLEPVDIRNAQEEFRKFDMENNGWIQKAVLMPVLKACLSLSGVREREAKLLLDGEALKSTISTYGLDDREEVHEIEFLSLFAFISRERERIQTTMDPRAKPVFTRNDLEMAYAFRQQMGVQKQGGQANQRALGVHRQFPNRQSYEQRASYYLPKSQTEDVISKPNPLAPPKMVAQSVRVSPQRPTVFAHSVLPSQFLSTEPQNMMEGQNHLRQSMNSDMYVPLGERLAARRAAMKRHSMVSGGDPAELAEEDQDDEEIPLLPPDKDPTTHQTNPLIGRTPVKNKRLMEEVNKELKLTGGEADSWMLY